MEIQIGPKTVDGKIMVIVNYYETIDECGQSASVEVWVDYSDSRSEIKSRAKVAAQEFLDRALTAHASVDQ